MSQVYKEKKNIYVHATLTTYLDHELWFP